MRLGLLPVGKQQFGQNHPIVELEDGRAGLDVGQTFVGRPKQFLGFSVIALEGKPYPLQVLESGSQRVDPSSLASLFFDRSQ